MVANSGMWEYEEAYVGLYVVACFNWTPVTVFGWFRVESGHKITRVAVRLECALKTWVVF